LPAGVDVGLDHDTSDVTVSASKLAADIVNHDGLVVVVLLRVAIYGKNETRNRGERGWEGLREQSTITEAHPRFFSTVSTAARTASAL
jgi:hypothetical protein